MVPLKSISIFDVNYYFFLPLLTILGSISAPIVEDDAGSAYGFSDEEEFVCRISNLTEEVHMKLSCCVLMLDLVLKQVIDEINSNHVCMYLVNTI